MMSILRTTLTILNTNLTVIMNHPNHPYDFPEHPGDYPEKTDDSLDYSGDCPAYPVDYFYFSDYPDKLSWRSWWLHWSSWKFCDQEFFNLILSLEAFINGLLLIYVSVDAHLGVKFKKITQRISRISKREMDFRIIYLQPSIS